MTDCSLKTEYDSQPNSIEVMTTKDGHFQIPDHAIECFAKFLYPRFLEDMKQRKKEAES